MDNFKIKDPPEYNEILRMLETSDRARADVFNVLFEQLINNDAFLKKFLDKVKETATEHIEDDEIHMTAQDKQTWNAKAGTGTATQSAAGLMSAEDKQKLDGIDSGAEVNQNAFSKVKVGEVTITANGKTAAFTLEAGSNITLSADNAAKKIIITANRDGGNAETLDGYHAEHFAAADHGHDGRYYTKAESDNLLKQKAASSHSHNNYAQKAIYKDDGVSLERTGVVGSKSIALGAYAVKATGPNSFAAGWLTEATGDTGTVFGYLTKAIGLRSFACGEQTEASGPASLAEGANTTASGYVSHAEGSRTKASAEASHAEGRNTEASVLCAHAEGENTKASMWAAHAEGCATKAVGDCAHTEGYYTFCDCRYGGHAEGMASIAAPTQCWLPIASYSGNVLTVDAAKADYVPTAMAKITAGMEIIIWNDYYANKSIYKYQVAAVNVSAKTITLNTALPASNFRVIDAVIPAIKNTKQYYPGHAEGTATKAVNNSSHAEGYNTTASGENSHAEGDRTIASGWKSHAEGEMTIASNYLAHAEGQGTKADSFAAHAGGMYNVAMNGQKNSWSRDYYVFVIGNGTNDNIRSNALSLRYNGILKTAGTITASTAADYAEFFEWLDGNPDAEDRVGHFVTLDGDKVRISDSTDTYILGIVSGRPFVLGNGDCDTWAGMYLHDAFNREITEPAPKIEIIEITEEVEREVQEIDEETGEARITTIKETIVTGHEEREVFDEDGNPVYEGTRPKLNPDYDYTQKYISRFDRPEWAAIGMLGVLAVYDDGSCQVNGYCKVATGGIATAAEGEYMLAEGKILRGYRVIERVADDIIKVIFR